ncbi:MAG: DUF4479 and tRNA-binding domain-containing protein [Lactobacillales bacterium]|jgi:tRNA-binding protein|nr:DUF4479 and tRNA-binding domain-containing protein [Lactobacillales bacterium]
MIFSYNPKHVGDVLMVIVANAADRKVDVERKGNVARVFTIDDKKTVAWNFFEVSTMISTIEGTGQVFLTEEQVDALNEEMKESGFEERLFNDKTPKFVVGQVKELKPHPDSDHLNITQTEVDGGKVLQIVCGAPNIEQGQKVVVAKTGAMMPDGTIIWPGSLRGVESNGMISSARELNLPNAPEVRGILVLSDDVETGVAFDVTKHWKK